VEFTSAYTMPDDSTPGAHPVATMSAPVLDADDRIGLVLAILPLRAMTIRGTPLQQCSFCAMSPKYGTR
jgi:hypothetical protein